MSTKYKLRITGECKQNMKLCKRRGLPMDELWTVVGKLLNGEQLEKKYQAHVLTGDRKGQWESHIHPDWLLIWEIRNQELVLVLLIPMNLPQRLAFEGRRSREKHSSNPIRTVALATLLSMSPMTNAIDVFAVEPNKPRIEVVTGLNSTQQNQFVPLPASCKILKDIHLEYPDGGYMGFKLINTDDDTSNYEMVEFMDVSSGGTVVDRGILKAVSISPASNGNSNIRLSGISLSKTDLNNYAPQKSIMRVSFFDSPNMANIFQGLINHPDNHGAVEEISTKTDYRDSYYYPTDLKIYKRILGIN